MSPSAGSSLNTGIVAFWKLEEASGTRVDEVGSNDLTDNNTVTQAAGIVGNAAQFTLANTEHLSLASNADVQMGDIDFTIACWIYLDSYAGADRRTFVSKDNSASGTREYMLGVDGGGGGFVFLVAKPTDSTVVKASSVLPEDLTTATWFFLVAYHDATANEIGISVNNGGFDTVTTGGSLQAASNAEFRIGARQYSSFEDHHNGRIDAVGLWKRVLTSDEITELYNSGNGLEYPF